VNRHEYARHMRAFRKAFIKSLAALRIVNISKQLSTIL